MPSKRRATSFVTPGGISVLPSPSLIFALCSSRRPLLLPPARPSSSSFAFRFAQLNNPRIPRGHQLNPLTGEVPPSPLLLPLPDDPQLLPTRRPPPVDLFPQSRKKPPLSSLAQVLR
mmetsp:Transcript_50710/g.158426  ORF Transcript_50710/g.158426 Transcript_50710/m.158426 type:complete len:117 (-) Transcript_50710:148-498(-)